MTVRKPWTHDELFVVLNIYHKLAFGQFDKRNPVIISLAQKMGRTTSSVAMKLCNLASFDPELNVRGIKGLTGASKLDKEVWEDFHANLDESIPASEDKLRELFSVSVNEEVEVSRKNGIQRRSKDSCLPSITEVTTPVKQRRGQSFFRNVVLNNYAEQCAVTRIAFRELLVASHILPWHSHPRERLDVRNGICLSRLHDAAFDCGLITFDDAYRLILSPQIKDAIHNHRVLAENFGAFEGVPLRFPEHALLPNPAFLANHRKTIFKSACRNKSWMKSECSIGEKAHEQKCKIIYVSKN